MRAIHSRGSIGHALTLSCVVFVTHAVAAQHDYQSLQQSESSDSWTVNQRTDPAHKTPNTILDPEVESLSKALASLIETQVQAPDGRLLFPPDLGILFIGRDKDGTLFVHFDDKMEPEGQLAEIIEELRLESLMGAFSAAHIDGGVWLWIRREEGNWRMLGDLERVFEAPIVEISDPMRPEVPPEPPTDSEALARSHYLGSDSEDKKKSALAPDPPAISYTLKSAGIVPGALDGITIALSAGHGWVPTGAGGWATQRDQWSFEGCLDCRGIVEDHFNAQIKMGYIIPLLERMGARIVVVRESDANTKSRFLLDSSNEHYSEDGEWTYDTPGVFSNEYRILPPNRKGSATFTPLGLEPGHHRIQLQWLEAGDRTAEAFITIENSHSSYTRVIDQRSFGRAWLDLGDFWLEPGDFNITIERNTTKGSLVLDTIKLGGGIYESSQKPWWQMAAPFYIAESGAPSRITALDDIGIRPAYAEYTLADYYVSIHANASGKPGGDVANGIETYRYSCQLYANHTASESALNCDDPVGSKNLIDTVHPAIVQRLRSDWDPNYNDRGTKVANFGELRGLDSIPGILIEAGFFDNIRPVEGRKFSDNQALHDPRFKEAFAYGLADGLAVLIRGEGASAPPRRPRGLFARNEPKGAMRIGWSAVDGADSYILYSAEGNRSFLPNYQVQENEILLDGLEPGQVYFFRVSAVDSNGESLPSMAVSARFAGRTRGSKPPADLLLIEGYKRRDAWTQMADNSLTYALEKGIALAQAGDGIIFDGVTHDYLDKEDFDFSLYRLLVYGAGKGLDRDLAWSKTVRKKIECFLDDGGSVIISGEDFARQLFEGSEDEDDVRFLRDRLALTPDDPQGGDHHLTPNPNSAFFVLQNLQVAEGDGEVYRVRRPNALNALDGGVELLHYSNGNIAAIATSNSIFIGVPIETILPQDGRVALFRASVEHLLPDLPLDTPPHIEGFGCGCNSNNPSKNSSQIILLLGALLGISLVIVSRRTQGKTL